MRPNCRSTMISRFAPTPRDVSGGRSTGALPAPHFMNCPHSVDSDWPWRCARSTPEPRATSYRTIAEGLFGAKRIPERAWKTHDLRNRTIRLVQNGFALMRGGYRDLLRQARRRK